MKKDSYSRLGILTLLAYGLHPASYVTFYYFHRQQCILFTSLHRRFFIALCLLLSYCRWFCRSIMARHKKKLNIRWLHCYTLIHLLLLNILLRVPGIRLILNNATARTLVDHLPAQLAAVSDQVDVVVAASVSHIDHYRYQYCCGRFGWFNGKREIFAEQDTEISWRTHHVVTTQHRHHLPLGKNDSFPDIAVIVSCGMRLYASVSSSPFFTTVISHDIRTLNESITTYHTPGTCISGFFLPPNIKAGRNWISNLMLFPTRLVCSRSQVLSRIV